MHAAPDSSARGAVPERGSHRRRAAPHAHRAGLRRRPGRRALLLRHAADRGQRAGPGDPPPPPHPFSAGDRIVVPRRDGGLSTAATQGPPHSSAPTSTASCRCYRRTGSGGASLCSRGQRGGTAQDGTWPSWKKQARRLVGASQVGSLAGGAGRRIPASWQGIVGRVGQRERRDRFVEARQPKAGHYGGRLRVGIGRVAARPSLLRHHDGDVRFRRSNRRGARRFSAGSPRSGFRPPMRGARAPSRGDSSRRQTVQSSDRRAGNDLGHRLWPGAALPIRG